MKAKALKYLESLVKDTTPKSECDLVAYCKKCVRAFTEKEQVDNKVDWLPMFETLWKMYPRKANKVLAKKTFEHKIRGLNEQECKDKCNQIYKAQTLRIKQWESEGRQIQYFPHYSSWLNAEIQNSKHYKGV